MKVTFSAEENQLVLSSDGKSFVRSGKIFEAGDYPDKQFSLTEAEMEAAVEQFQPVDANIEHRPSLLDGELGGLKRIWRQGKELFGEISVPAWLHAANKGKPIKPSLEFDRETKCITGIGYVLHPRITDAALMAAFSASTEFGTADKGRMQAYHDMACRDGAECTGAPLFSDPARFMTPADLKAVQKIHDHAAQNGASCDAWATRQAMYFNVSEAHVRGAGKERTHMSSQEGNGEGSGAGLVQSIVGFLQEKGLLKAEVAPAPAKPADFSSSAEFTAMKAEIEELKATAAGNAAAAVFASDSAYIDKLVREFKLTPSEAETWKGIAKETPAAFSATKPALEARQPIEAVAGTTDGDGARGDIEGASTSADSDKLHQLALAHSKENGVSYSAAFSTVCRENPELAKSVAFSAPAA